MTKILSQNRGKATLVKGVRGMFHLKPFTSQAKKEVAKQDKGYNLILLNQNLYLFLEGIQKYYFMNFTCQFILLHNNLYFFISSEFFKLNF